MREGFPGKGWRTPSSGRPGNSEKLHSAPCREEAPGRRRVRDDALPSSAVVGDRLPRAGWRRPGIGAGETGPPFGSAGRSTRTLFPITAETLQGLTWPTAQRRRGLWRDPHRPSPRIPMPAGGRVCEARAAVQDTQEHEFSKNRACRVY